jgi:hypothetical protein
MNSERDANEKKESNFLIMTNRHSLTKKKRIQHF